MLLKNIIGNWISDFKFKGKKPAITNWISEFTKKE